MTSRYDSAITRFSPNGHLFQVEYAMEAVKRGLCCVAVRGQDCIVLGVEKKTVTKLQEHRTMKKILQLDKNICISFSGLNADARILANMARAQCQIYSLNYDDQPSVDYIAKYMAQTQQKYTQKGGVRPFGISVLIAGFDKDKRPKLFQTDPSGANTEWKATSLGRNSKQVKDYLEKNYKDNLSQQDAILLTIRSLIEVVESGKKNIELVIVKDGSSIPLDENQISQLVDQIEELEIQK